MDRWIARYDRACPAVLVLALAVLLLCALVPGPGPGPGPGPQRRVSVRRATVRPVVARPHTGPPRRAGGLPVVVLLRQRSPARRREQRVSAPVRARLLAAGRALGHHWRNYTGDSAPGSGPAPAPTPVPRLLGRRGRPR